MFLLCQFAQHHQFPFFGLVIGGESDIVGGDDGVENLIGVLVVDSLISNTGIQYAAFTKVSHET